MNTAINIETIFNEQLFITKIRGRGSKYGKYFLYAFRVIIYILILKH